MKVTKAKAWAAVIGGLGTLVVEIASFLSDGVLDGGELTTIAGSVFTLASTAYAVWRTRNKPIV